MGSLGKSQYDLFQPEQEILDQKKFLIEASGDETNEIWDRTYHVKVREKKKEGKILQFMMPKIIEKYVRNTC